MSIFSEEAADEIHSPVQLVQTGALTTDDRHGQFEELEQWLQLNYAGLSHTNKHVSLVLN